MSNEGRLNKRWHRMECYTPIKKATYTTFKDIWKILSYDTKWKKHSISSVIFKTYIWKKTGGK